MLNQEANLETVVKFTWTINNFSQELKNCKMLYSQTFFAGANPWRLLLYREGDDDEDEDYEEEEEKGLSIYFVAVDSAIHVERILCCSRFKLSLINQIDCKMTRTKTTSDDICIDFLKSHVRMGCSSFITFDKFLDSKNGFLVNDSCVIVAEASVNNNASLGSRLIDLNGGGKIGKVHLELLDKACSKHPSLIESLIKSSQRFIEGGFTALGRVLHFLKTKKMKDMMNDDAARKELQDLWDEVERVGFDDLTWLEPHVRSALSMKDYIQREEVVTKLKGNVVDLEDRVKRAKRELEIAEKDFDKRDLNDALAHGISYL
ncbi:hypothetical protein HN51_048988 [Arachis hypogaea]|nr:MATH domain and coiled-coil domain-containing protein At3g58410-like [Arachis hypogaea]QHO25680.1 Ubiquitin carboxyl-terminal hydrolase [Arachis hypogaea]